MWKHTKGQLQYYYKSQLYNAFVISDVCNRSWCVIPFKTETAKNQEHLLYRYVPPHRFLRFFGLKTGVDFVHLGLESGMGFEKTTGLYEHNYRFNSK